MALGSTCNSELNVSASLRLDLVFQLNQRGNDIRVLNLHDQRYFALRWSTSILTVQQQMIRQNLGNLRKHVTALFAQQDIPQGCDLRADARPFV
jgi:hypothetical protein